MSQDRQFPTQSADRMLEAPVATNPEAPLIGLRGFLIDTPEYGRIRSWKDGAVVIENGRIAEVGLYQFLGKKPRPRPVKWLHSERVAIFPGLIDAHTHLPQYPVVARGRGQLLDWLHHHVFPRERGFTGPSGAREAGAFFSELARNGTTTAVIYAAIYEDSCDAAFHSAAQSGLRVVMGKTMMDLGSYGSLQPRKVLSVSLMEAERLCRKWNGQADGLLDYAFSPRFALACSDRLMRAVADMARDFGCYIQTHLSENREECERVRHLFPKAADYTDVYAQAGLLGPRTILGHCIHITPRERAVLAETGTSIAHCPTSNLFLSSGVMPLGEHQAAGIRIALGTDVAGGPELNLWQVMRSTIESQKARSFHTPDVTVPTPAQALYLATQGAADALGKGAIIGTLDAGKEADLTVIDIASLLPYHGSATKFEDLTADDLLPLCIYRGGPHAVLETFVRGRSVWQAQQPELF